ncbi:hypothetical protein CASFOL_002778 [Castilleja foliolosa]|uniref:MADS-box domain-containing protein n=1 Tax=Castilleja foliolosa TaxID=1961234 RepID=A0ABD3EFP4_9LAMI
MVGKRTKGRQRIQIKKIVKESDCFASFSKRRLGLLRKASDISTLCDLDIGMVIYSPTGKPFSFFHPTMESVIGRAQNPNGYYNNVKDASRLSEAFTRTRVLQLNQMLGKLGQQMEAEKEREERLGVLVNEPGWCNWGCDEAIEEFSKEQVKQFMGWLENMPCKRIGTLRA